MHAWLSLFLPNPSVHPSILSFIILFVCLQDSRQHLFLLLLLPYLLLSCKICAPIDSVPSGADRAGGDGGAGDDAQDAEVVKRLLKAVSQP
jgi:hypothetical protein